MEIDASADVRFRFGDGGAGETETVSIRDIQRGLALLRSDLVEAATGLAGPITGLTSRMSTLEASFACTVLPAGVTDSDDTMHAGDCTAPLAHGDRCDLSCAVGYTFPAAMPAQLQCIAGVAVTAPGLACEAVTCPDIVLGAGLTATSTDGVYDTT